MNKPPEILTIDEVAAYLRSDASGVRQLLDEGRLAGFKIGGEWRVLSSAVVKFVEGATFDAQRQSFARVAADPRLWGRDVLDDPEQAALLREHEFPDGSTGAVLKETLRVEELESSAGNIVRLEPRDG